MDDELQAEYVAGYEAGYENGRIELLDELIKEVDSVEVFNHQDIGSAEIIYWLEQKKGNSNENR